MLTKEETWRVVSFKQTLDDPITKSQKKNRLSS